MQSAVSTSGQEGSRRRRDRRCGFRVWLRMVAQSGFSAIVLSQFELVLIRSLLSSPSRPSRPTGMVSTTYPQRLIIHVSLTPIARYPLRLPTCRPSDAPCLPALSSRSCKRCSYFTKGLLSCQLQRRSTTPSSWVPSLSVSVVTNYKCLL